MKTLKLISASLLACALAGSAFATSVRITGSTAIRKALYAGIVRTLANDGTVYIVGCDPNFNNKTPDGAQQATFVSVSGGAVVNSVQACLSGSVGGIGYVVSGSNVQSSITLVGDPNKAWISVPGTVATITTNWPSVTVTAGGAFTYTGGTIAVNGVAGNLGQTSTVSSGNFDAAGTASITMSDSYQDSTIYDSTDWGVTLNDTQEGTVTFVLAKGAAHPSLPTGSYSRLTNLTSQNFQALVNKGFISLQQITNNVSDANVDVVLVGRNSDSGTRLGTFAETGVGAVNTGAKQYIPEDASNNDASLSTAGNITHFVLVSTDQDGYDSGAFVKATLTKTVDSTAVGPGGAGHTFIQVSYVSEGDTPGSGQELTYNGVTMSQSNVINGTYTLWTTEHFLYDPTPGVLTAGQVTLASNIKGNITATNSNGNYVNQGSLSCHRAAHEGSTVLAP